MCPSRSARSDRAGRTWRFRVAARFSRSKIGARRLRSESVAKTWPRLPMAAAMASDLPPAPAQRSSTCSPGCGAGEQRRELAALVLDLEPALLEAGLDLEVGVAAVADDRRNPEAVRSKRHLDRAMGRERLGDLLAFGLQPVDADVERRALRQRRALLHPVRAETLLQPSGQPLRHVCPHVFGSLGKITGLEPLALGPGERRRRVRIGVDQRIERSGGQTAGLAEGDDHRRTRRRILPLPLARCLLPKGVVDHVADRGAVLGARETVGNAPLLQGLRHRPVPGLDRLEHLDRGCKPPTRGHRSPRVPPARQRPASSCFNNCHTSRNESRRDPCRSRRQSYTVMRGRSIALVMIYVAIFTGILK